MTKLKTTLASFALPTCAGRFLATALATVRTVAASFWPVAFLTHHALASLWILLAEITTIATAVGVALITIGASRWTWPSFQLGHFV